MSSNRQAPGSLLIVSAPSGAGKTSLVRALVESDDRIRVSVSHTTRPKRPAESDGRDYHFVSTEKFLSLVASGAFLEHAQVFRNHYGTTRDSVIAQMARGFDVVLEIDWQGAQQVRESFPEAVSIFILPPSRAALRERLTRRQQDPVEEIAVRMAQSRAETGHWSEFDYVVINDRFDRALADLAAIVRACRLSCSRQAVALEPMLSELLS